MEDHEENSKQRVKKTQKPRNRKNKTQLIFNDNARREFLSGFRKRKNERRMKAREEMELQLKDDKKRLKDEHRSKLKKFMENDRPVPEVEHILTPVVYDLPDHVVTISSSTDVDLASHGNVRLGLNKETEVEDEKSEAENDNSDYLKCDKIVMKNALKKSNQILVQSKAYKMKQKIKQKKDRQKQRMQKMRNKNCKTKKRNVGKHKSSYK